MDQLAFTLDERRDSLISGPKGLLEELGVFRGYLDTVMGFAKAASEVRANNATLNYAHPNAMCQVDPVAKAVVASVEKIVQVIPSRRQYIDWRCSLLCV